jgi:hypothetical protein
VIGAVEKLIALSKQCEASVSLTYRAQSDYYETLEQQSFESDSYYTMDKFLSEEDREKCIESDKYWTLHFYPRTPVSFYCAHASCPKMLLDWALKLMEDHNDSKNL